MMRPETWRQTQPARTSVVYKDPTRTRMTSDGRTWVRVDQGVPWRTLAIDGLTLLLAIVAGVILGVALS